MGYAFGSMMGDNSLSMEGQAANRRQATCGPAAANRRR